MKVVYFSYYVALTLTKTFKGFLIQVGDAGGVGEFFFDYEVCKFEVFKPLGKFTHLEFGPKNYLEIEILDKLQQDLWFQHNGNNEFFTQLNFLSCIAYAIQKLFEEQKRVFLLLCKLNFLIRLESKLVTLQCHFKYSKR